MESLIVNVQDNSNIEQIISAISLIKGINKISSFDENKWKKEIVYPQLELSIEQVKNGECSKSYNDVDELIKDLEA